MIYFAGYGTKGALMRLKKLSLFLVLLISAILPSFGASQVKLINGSNIYNRIFIFFFPVGKKYDSYTTKYRDKFALELTISRNNLQNPPRLEDTYSQQLIDSNLVFTILDIPQAKTGEFTLPVSIRCNERITQKKVKFTIVTKEDIMVLSGKMTNLQIGELTSAPYFRNRMRWYNPFYFDLRLQLPRDMVSPNTSTAK